MTQPAQIQIVSTMERPVMLVTIKTEKVTPRGGGGEEAGALAAYPTACSLLFQYTINTLSILYQYSHPGR